ncbi:NTP transferase domain-containing protein [Halobellus rubicundus]|uniref:NTP transferase domain-containing protein n=1 Tax=Halobellus rubicundus TaxID=2996466 RepID=A0ABD5MCG7_9EURY
MCGGRGTRLRDGSDRDASGVETEKPLVEVCGRSMLERVAEALRESGLDGTVHAVVSPQAPETAARAADLSLSTVETPGEGYVADLGTALDAVGRPALTVPADLPLLSAEHVDDALARAGTGDGGAANADSEPTSLTVCVPAALKRQLGASADTTFEHEGREVTPTGLNVVAGDGDTVALTYDARLAVNVNRPRDRALAEALCG